MMRFAFFGSSLVSAYWNGAATYYRGLLRALAERGHQIAFYEPDAFNRQANRDIPDPAWASVQVYQPTEDSALRMLEHARAADVIVKASGVGVLDAFLERAVLDLQGPGRTVVFWDVDAPATLERVAADQDDPFRALIGRYDAVFTYGGGDPVIDAYGRLGARACIPIYNALDEESHKPVSPQPAFAADLSFMGNRLPDREARVHEFLLKPARLLPHRSFLLGGSGWEPDMMPANVRAIGHVFTADHNAFNCSATTVLNVTRDSMVRFGHSPATRIFEAAGAGACLITDAWDGIERFLEPGREVLVARNGEDVAAFVESTDAVEARRIGRAARKAVLAKHTYRSRAAEVERALSGSGRAAHVKAS
jgi:spore maturation protein CgeB